MYFFDDDPDNLRIVQEEIEGCFCVLVDANFGVTDTELRNAVDPEFVGLSVPELIEDLQISLGGVYKIFKYYNEHVIADQTTANQIKMIEAQRDLLNCKISMLVEEMMLQEQILSANEFLGRDPPVDIKKERTDEEPSKKRK